MAKINPELIAELQPAFADNQFILHYQPIINLENEQIVGAEVLIRWQHPTYGLLPPDRFLSLCEESGFIIPLGTWILHSACQQLKKWHANGYSKLYITVNLSAQQFNHPDFIETINEVLNRQQLKASSLKLELTENIIMPNEVANIRLLKSLRNLGLHLALDDFGTGYAALNYLKQFPYNILKIDKSFIADMTTSITSLALVESIISLAKNLGLEVIAEGVETQSQLHILKKMQCDMAQGYFYSPPLATEAFNQLLIKSREVLFHPEVISIKSSTQSYQFKKLSIEHYEQAVNIITQAFCNDEPMAKYLEIPHYEFLPFAELIIQKAIKDALSIVALDENKVIACSVIEDMTDPLLLTFAKISKLNIIFSFLEHLNIDFFNPNNIEKGHLVNLLITAIDKNYHGQSLSKAINIESIKSAEKKGFDFMYGKFTHTQHGKRLMKYLKNNKLLIKSCNYSDFIFNDEKPFKNFPGTACSYLWELYEGAKLRWIF